MTIIRSTNSKKSVALVLQTRAKTRRTFSCGPTIPAISVCECFSSACCQENGLFDVKAFGLIVATLCVSQNNEEDRT